MIYREMLPSEYDLLKDFLYEAIFIPEGVAPADRSIVELPELTLYYEGCRFCKSIPGGAESQCRGADV